MTLWLWFTLLFANFAEAMAEGRSKAQAASLQVRPTRYHREETCQAPRDATQWTAPSTPAQGRCRPGGAGDRFPATARSSKGSASIDESAITGESAPVIRAAGSDFNAVTGGTRVLSDWLIVRITSIRARRFSIA